MYCKHINAIILFNKLKNKVYMKGLDVGGITKEKACPSCKSERIIKKGIRKNKSGNKQDYKCKECGLFFILDPAEGIEGNARILCLALDMYYKGNSLRDTQNTLYQSFGLKLHHEKIRRWNNRFVKKINSYTNTIRLQTSDTMHIDEQMLSVKGEHRWCWNTLDSDSRFLLATQITKVRRIKDARGIIQKTKAIISEKLDYVATDEGAFYIKTLKREFPTNTGNNVFFHKKGISHLNSKNGQPNHRALSCDL